MAVWPRAFKLLLDPGPALVLRVVVVDAAQVLFQMSRALDLVPSSSTDFVNLTTPDVLDLAFMDNLAPAWGIAQPAVSGTWTMGDSWEIASPGVPPQLAPGTGVVEEWNVVSVQKIGATGLRVRFDAPVAFYGGMPGTAFEDTTTSNTTLTRTTNFDAFTMQFITGISDFIPGNGWAWNVGSIGQDVAQTGTVV